MLNKILKILLVVDLIVVNLLLGYLVYRSFKVAGSPSNEVTKNEVTYVDQCGEERKKYIDERLLVTPEPTMKAVYVKPTVKTKTRTVQYVTVSGSGNTMTNDWANVTATDFYFDTKDYPGLVEIYFETNIKLLNGNGVAYVRLFDVTHGIGVQGSDVSSNNQADTTVTSGKLTFWAGKNLIRVQAKSLTADTAVYNWGRLRVVTEN